MFLHNVALNINNITESEHLLVADALEVISWTAEEPDISLGGW